MQRLLLLWAALVGPCYGMMLLVLLLARPRLRGTQILDGPPELFLLPLAAIVALAVAGVVVQLG